MKSILVRIAEDELARADSARGDALDFRLRQAVAKTERLASIRPPAAGFPVNQPDCGGTIQFLRSPFALGFDRPRSGRGNQDHRVNDRSPRTAHIPALGSAAATVAEDLAALIRGESLQVLDGE
jgi:hypothetical protein